VRIKVFVTVVGPAAVVTTLDTVPIFSAKALKTLDVVTTAVAVMVTKYSPGTVAMPLIASVGTRYSSPGGSPVTVTTGVGVPVTPSTT